MNPVMDPRFAKKGIGGNMPGVCVPPWRLQLVEEMALVGPREPSPRKLPGTVLGIFKTLFLSYSSYTWHIISLRTTFLFNCSQPPPPPITTTKSISGDYLLQFFKTIEILCTLNLFHFIFKMFILWGIMKEIY